VQCRANSQHLEHKRQLDRINTLGIVRRYDGHRKRNGRTISVMCLSPHPLWRLIFCAAAATISNQRPTMSRLEGKRAANWSSGQDDSTATDDSIVPRPQLTSIALLLVSPIPEGKDDLGGFPFPSIFLFLFRWPCMRYGKR
jgi:hypothetical protein